MISLAFPTESLTSEEKKGEGREKGKDNLFDEINPLVVGKLEKYQVKKY